MADNLNTNDDRSLGDILKDALNEPKLSQLRMDGAKLMKNKIAYWLNEQVLHNLQVENHEHAALISDQLTYLLREF